MVTPSFPIPPAPFTGKARQAEAGACFDWIRQAWAMFTANPGVWVASGVLLIVFYLALQIVPVIGSLVANLLLPALTAGLMAMCRRQSLGDNAELGDLLRGFQGPAASPLVQVGALSAGGFLLVFALAALIAGGSLAGGIATGRAAGLGIAFGGLLVTLLLAAVLATPILMALCFAPALVYFHGMMAWPAMRASFQACALNWLSLSVHGLLLLVLTFFALLPAGLGLLILIPIFYGTLYAAYRDIFPTA